MIPSTVARVPQQTAEHVNERIRRQTEESVARLAARGSAAIDRRLADLDREWDIERTLEANAATAVLVGSALGALMDRRFFALPAVVGGFLLQHAVQGWCPPLPLFRRAGVRTAAEIDYERYALKALRGDFANAERANAGPADTSRVVAAARR
jgi:F0F1-type ATP synthase assembly protein I